MTAPRSVEARIDWFLAHDPSGHGMCAQHTWHSLGGDQGNPPAWGCSDANACIDKIKASGRYWTPSSWSGPPPRGAWVGYKYGNNGHACLSLGDGRIATTDPGSGAMVGVEDLDYPNKWGASGWDIWTDQYAGVRFDVGDEMGDPYVYDYLGKHDGQVVIGQSYVELDGSEWDPPCSGWEHTYIYLNIQPTNWVDSQEVAGMVRLRIVRADGDATGHIDLVIVRRLNPDGTLRLPGGTIDEDGRTLHHVLYWEAGDGKPTHVEVKCEGGLTKATLHTRYVKKALIPA